VCSCPNGRLDLSAHGLAIEPIVRREKTEEHRIDAANSGVPAVPYAHHSKPRAVSGIKMAAHDGDGGR
jgi:hypothetical protein